MSVVANLLVNIGADTRQLDQGFDRADRGISDMSRRVEQSGGSFDVFGEIAVGALRRVGEVAINAGMALGGLAVSGFGAASDAGMEFEATMSGVRAVLSPTAEEFENLSAKALQIGKDTSYGAGEAASAIEMLAKNGLDATAILNGAADATIALAAATGADLSTAADIGTDAMAIFKISAEDMSRAINGISGVTVASKFSINDYSLALAQAGGVAGASGVSFEDFNATIATISPLFASGSDAGTSFKTMLQNLIPKSADAADAMREIGLYSGLTGKEFDAQREKIDSLKAKLAELDTTNGNFAEQSKRLNDRIAETRLELAALDPESENYEARLLKLNNKLEDYTASLSELSPTNADAAAKAEKLKTEIAALEATLTAGSNAFYDANGNMKDMREVAQILQNALGGLSEEQKNNALSTIFGTDAMRAAVALADAGAEGFDNLAASIAEVDAGEQAATRLDNLSGDIEALKGSLETISIEAFSALTPALRQGTQALTAFVNRFVGIDYGPFVSGLQAAITRVTAIINRLSTTQGRNDLFTGIVDNARMQFNTLKLYATIEAKSIWDRFIEGTQAKFSELQSYTLTQGPIIISNLITSFQSALPGWIAAIQQFATPLVNWLIDAIPQIANNFLTWRNALVGYVLSSLPGWMDALVPYAAALGQWVLDALPGVLANFTIATTELINLIGANLPAIIEKLGEWAIALGQWIVDALPGVLASLGIVVGSILDTIGANLPGIVTALATWGAEFVAWALAALPGLLDSLGGLLAGMIGWIVERAPEILTTLATWAGQFIAWAIPIAADLIVKLGEAFGRMLIWLDEKTPEIGAKVKAWSDAFSAWVMDVAWPAIKEKLGEWWTSFTGWITEQVGNVAANSGSIGTEFVAGIWNGIVASWGKLATDFNNLLVGLVPEQMRGAFGISATPTAAAPGGTGGSIGIPAASDIAAPAVVPQTQGGTGTTVVQNISGSVVTQADLAEQIRLAIDEYNRRNG